MPSKLADRMSEKYAKDLAGVMADLEAQIITLMKNADKENTQIAATLLNSRAQFMQALNESGYTALSQEYVGQFAEIPAAVSKSFKSRRIPAPEFTTVSAETFSGLARIDLQAFNAIGQKAMDDLRIGIYKQVIAGQPFTEIVKLIKASTTGEAKNGSPLSNYSTTHANTAVLEFNGAVTIEAGESIGADMWEVVGPDDDRTRDICLAALADPVRSKKEWLGVGYWGGAPGGWNCRHELYPYFGE